jgi:hypothetical protein
MVVALHRQNALAFAACLLAVIAASACGGEGHDKTASAGVVRQAPSPKSSPKSSTRQENCVAHTARPSRLLGRTRVLFMGDSITGNMLVDGNGEALFERHGFDVQRSATPGFGLLDDPQHGYSNEMALRVASFDPDVVVLEFIGNYHAFGDPGLRGVEIDTPAFYTAWNAEAASLTRLAAARGAQVFWVLGPTVGISQGWVDRVHTIAHGYRALSATLCETRYVDAFKVIGDPWVAGPWRTPDGVHLTAEGGAVLARAICDRIVGESVATTDPCGG